MLSQEGVEEQTDYIYLMKPKTLLKIMLTMIPLMMMKNPNQNSDFLTFSGFLIYTKCIQILSIDLESTSGGWRGKSLSGVSLSGRS